MQNRLIELHQQRGQLVERVASQRQVLAQQLAPLQSSFNIADRVAGVVQDGKAFVQRHPLAIAAAVAGMVLLKPRTVWRWGQRGLVAWRTWRTWRSVSGLLPAFIADRVRGFLR